VGEFFNDTPEGNDAKSHTVEVFTSFNNSNDIYGDIKRRFVQRGNKLPERLGHAVVNVKDTVYDITAEQYNLPNSYPFAKFLAQWKNVYTADIELSKDGDFYLGSVKKKEKLDNDSVEPEVDESQLIDPVTPKMASQADNSMFSKYRRFCEPVEKLSDTITLYYGEGNTRNVYMAAKSEGVEGDDKVVYLMEFERDSNRLLGEFAIQRWLWMDKAYKGELGNLPTRMFNELIDDYFTVIADSEQTPDGKKFWLRQLHAAFGSGLNVYYADLNKNVLKQLQKPGDISRYDFAYGVWTRAESSLEKVFVISSKKLRVTK
jgi:hypothetical protein